jgi:hypothetical protein
VGNTRIEQLRIFQVCTAFPCFGCSNSIAFGPCARGDRRVVDEAFVKEDRVYVCTCKAEIHRMVMVGF